VIVLLRGFAARFFLSALSGDRAASRLRHFASLRVIIEARRFAELNKSVFRLNTRQNCSQTPQITTKSPNIPSICTPNTPSEIGKIGFHSVFSP
jgi:hypothetical protein